MDVFFSALDFFVDLKHIMRFDRLMEEGTRRGNGSRDGLGLGEIADGRGVEGKGRGV
jgi:hypothetical protein